MTSQPPASSSQELFTLKIPGQAQYIGIARLAVSGLASQLDFPYDEAEDLKLAVTEACSHLLRSAEQTVLLEIGCQRVSDVLHIKVRSMADGKGCPPPGLNVEEAAHSGAGGDPELGMYLVEALMDRVEMETDAATGTVAVSMARRLPTAG